MNPLRDSGMLDEHGEGDRQDHRRLAVRRVHGAGTRIGRRPDRVAAPRHASCPVGELFTQLGKGMRIPTSQPHSREIPRRVVIRVEDGWNSAV